MADFSPMTTEESLYRTCDAMLQFAMANNKTVPPELVSDFESVSNKVPKLNPIKIMYNQWLSDSPPLDLSKSDMMTLAHLRNELLKIVSPARPQTLLLMQNDSLKNGKWQVFGSVPLLRNLLAVAFLCLILMIGLGASGGISTATQKSIFETSGVQLLINAGFLLSAAGLGAAFSALFRARNYVTDATYDPKYEASYWIEFAIGLIAGVILAEFIFIDGGTTGLGEKTMIVGGKVSLAMLGGFSGLVVYRILNRLTYALEALVRQRSEDLLDAEMKKLEADSLRSITDTRTNLAREITKLQSELVYKSLTTTEINARLENLVDNVVEDKYKPVESNNIGTDGRPTFETPNNTFVQYSNLDSPEHDTEDYTKL